MFHHMLIAQLTFPSPEMLLARWHWFCFRTAWESPAYRVLQMHDCEFARCDYGSSSESANDVNFWLHSLVHFVIGSAIHPVELAPFLHSRVKKKENQKRKTELINANAIFLTNWIFPRCICSLAVRKQKNGWRRHRLYWIEFELQWGKMLWYSCRSGQKLRICWRKLQIEDPFSRKVFHLSFHVTTGTARPTTRCAYVFRKQN